MYYKTIQKKIQAVKNDGSIKAMSEIYNISLGNCRKGRGNTVVINYIDGSELKIPYGHMLVLDGNGKLYGMTENKFTELYEPYGEDLFSDPEDETEQMFAE